MAYSDFALTDLRERFGLMISEGGNLFAHVAEVDLPAALQDSLNRSLDGTQATIDGVEYPIQSPRRLYGILSHIALGNDVPSRRRTEADA